MNFSMEALLGIYHALTGPEQGLVSEHARTLVPAGSDPNGEEAQQALFGVLIAHGHIAEFREPLMAHMAEDYDLAMQGADLLDCQPAHVEPNKSHTRRYGP